MRSTFYMEDLVSVLFASEPRSRYTVHTVHTQTTVVCQWTHAREGGCKRRIVRIGTDIRTGGSVVNAIIRLTDLSLVP